MPRRLEPNWLTPLLGVLSWFDILFPETGTNIPARMDIIGGRDKQGRPFQRWNRGFTFPQVFRRFNAIMTYDDDRKSVIEVMGPAGVIQIEWKVAFEPPDTIRIETSRCYLVIGLLKLRLPALLHPSVVAIETTHGDMTMHVDLRVSHIFFGEVFGYDGTFTVQQTEIITSSDDSPVAT